MIYVGVELLFDGVSFIVVFIIGNGVMGSSRRVGFGFYIRNKVGNCFI